MTQGDQNPVALITGSTKGIGKAVAQALAAKGVDVVVTSRSLQRAQNTAHEIVSTGANAIGVAFDICNPAHIEQVVEHAVENYGRLDILVNNAVSQNALVPSSDFDHAKIIQTVTENLTHSYLLSQAAYPHLLRTKGNILNIGSVVANRHLLGLPLYGLIKGGVIQMTKVLAAEWAGIGIRVNAINPGFVRTSAFSDLGMAEQQVQECYKYYDAYQPLSGVGNPQSIASAATFLTAPGAGFITGSILEVDGGYSVKGNSLAL